MIKRLQSYEERITLWQAASFEEAIALAEAEADEYAAIFENHEVLDLWQAFWLSEEPGHGEEVFSLIRESELGSDEYVDHFFETGAEHQTTTEGETP